MKIVVLVKEVPDTYEDRKLNLETGLADRAASEPVVDEIGERALEVALAAADADSTVEVSVLSMGPESAAASIRKALAIGATSAIHVADEALHGADVSLTGEVLAAALERAGFDLVIAGVSSTDGTGGILPAVLAEQLDVAGLTALSSVDIGPDSVSGRRVIDGGVLDVTAEYPALISVTEALPDARFPNFRGIMAAKKKPIETWSLADLGITVDPDALGRSIVIGVAEKPPRSAGIKVADDGTAAAQLADFLATNRLI